MDIVSRVKNIILTPNTEWPVIAGEPSNTGGLIGGYVIPLALIGPIASIIGGAIAGVSIITGVITGIIAVVSAIIGVLLDGFIFSKVAGMFGGRDDMGQGFKLAAYSFTPGWVIAIVDIIVPMAPIVGLLVFVGLIYGLYLIYAGASPVMGVPKEKAVGYTVVAIIVAIVVYFVIAAIIAAIVGVVLLSH